MTTPVCKRECAAHQRCAIQQQPGRKHAIASGPQNNPNELADDILRGADAIAEFIYGEGASRRKVYGRVLAATCIPVGSMLCARKSVLLGWISGQESRVKGSVV
jgi:hypothetical protein